MLLDRLVDQPLGLVMSATNHLERVKQMSSTDHLTTGAARLSPSYVKPVALDSAAIKAMSTEQLSIALDSGRYGRNTMRNLNIERIIREALAR